jgi:hypothetical protein
MYNMVLYLCVLIVFSLRQKSLKLILATDPLPRWFCHNHRCRGWCKRWGRTVGAWTRGWDLVGDLGCAIDFRDVGAQGDHRSWWRRWVGNSSGNPNFASVDVRQSSWWSRRWLMSSNSTKMQSIRVEVVVETTWSMVPIMEAMHRTDFWYHVGMDLDRVEQIRESGDRPTVDRSLRWARRIIFYFFLIKYKPLIYLL